MNQWIPGRLSDLSQADEKCVMRALPQFKIDRLTFVIHPMNGWNLKITHLQRKVISNKPSLVCSMFIFRGVFLPSGSCSHGTKAKATV